MERLVQKQRDKLYRLDGDKAFLQDGLKKLYEYEDTGLTPWEIKENSIAFGNDRAWFIEQLDLSKAEVQGLLEDKHRQFILIEQQGKELNRLREDVDHFANLADSIDNERRMISGESDQWHREAVKANAELGEIKILEGLGLRIDLPCKVGDTVYIVLDDYGELFIQEDWTVTEITIVGDDILFDFECFQTEESESRSIDSFGKTVFLTKGEADETLQKGSVTE